MAAPRRKLPLHTKILLGLLIGAVAGIAASAILGAEDPQLAWTVNNITEPIGQLFLRLLLMVVVPLVFSAIVVGVAGVGDVRALGRIGLKTFGYTLVISAISVGIGLAFVNTVKPHTRIDAATAAGLEARYGRAAEQEVKVDEATEAAAPKPSVLERVIETLIPVNPFADVATTTPNLLHLMFFALAFGIGATFLAPAVTQPLVSVLQSVFDISTKLVDLIMLIAPYAVACLLFSAISSFGLDLLGALAWFMGTVLAALAVQMFVVYSASVYFLSGLEPIEFFKRIRTVMLTAFSTSSSNATLPTALRETEQKLGVPQTINSFVLTVGATANQNGTALYEGVTIIFLAQLAGVDLTLSMQVVVAYMAILGGIGTAGVPGGSIPFIVVVLASLGVDPAIIAIVLGVDRLLDMCRTTLNVTGDITAATYVARSEGHTLLGSRERAA